MIETLKLLTAGQATPQQMDELWKKRQQHLARFQHKPAGLNKQSHSLEAFRSVHPQIQNLWENEGIQSEVGAMLWLYWLPLAEAISDQYHALNRPMIQGILGGQGTGKTTLCKVLVHLLGHFGITAHALSIDDLYKTYEERQSLQRKDSRLIWRGPPGTHDVALGLQIFEDLRNGDASEPLEIPQFNKYAFEGQGDRTLPLSIKKPEILLFEGWFVGARPVDSDRFQTPLDPIQTSEDKRFALDMNTALAEYLPLWNQLDSLLVLHPEDYQLSLTWRWEAESKAIAQGETGMSQSEITEFVQYFWKALHPQLFIEALINNPNWVDYVMDINAAHQPTRLYSPNY